MLVDTLTPQQRDALRAFHQEWLEVGLSTTPADRPAAEAAITRLYAEVGRPAPTFVWQPSPMACMQAMDQLRRGSAGRPPGLWDELWDGPYEGQENALAEELYLEWEELEYGDSYGYEDEQKLPFELVAGLGNGLLDGLWDGLGAPLWGQLRQDLARPPHAPTEPWLSERGWGQHNVYWIALHLFAASELGVQYPPRRRRLIDLWAVPARSCGWWWPYGKCCVVSERPVHVRMEPHGRPRQRGELAGTRPLRPHAGDGPAVAFRDGWSIWAWHGVRVPRQVIEAPESLRWRQILGERNAAVRSVMIERLGADRFLRDCAAQLIHEDHDSLGHPRHLWRIVVGHGEPICFIEVTNSTQAADGSWRTYVLRVPPGIRTCQQAVAWTFGLAPHEYRPSVET